MDRVPQETRSVLMARVRHKDTKPEMKVRRLAHRLGFRFRLHRPDMPGKPDLVFPSRRAAILVHGCFWHQHEGCRKATIPRTRQDFWEAKLGRNVERDRATEAALRKLGWRVLVVWECETSDEEALSKRLIGFLEEQPSE